MSVTPRQAEILEAQIDAGRRARALLGAGLAELHAEREGQVLDKLIAWFRSEPWDDRTAVRYIALLSENRAQREEIEHRARKAEEAARKLYSTDTAEED